MSSEEVTGTVSGAAQGAAAGAAVGGPVGAVVGGILGGLGGLFGGKSKKYQRKAGQVERRMAGREVAVQRRQLIRAGYIARAQAAAAAAAQEGTLSSASQGAISSVGSQLGFNLNYFDTQVESLGQRNEYLKKAGKYAGYADLVGSLANLGVQAYGLSRSIGSSTSGSTGGSSISLAGGNSSPYYDANGFTLGKGNGFTLGG